MKPFSIPVRVYWEDTDAQGVVYFGNYFRYMERARTEWLQWRGVDQEVLRREQGLVFAVIDTGLKFRQPARFGDRLTVSAELADARGTRFSFRQVIRRDGEDGILLCEGHCEVAGLDAITYKPRRLPAQLVGEFQSV